MKGYWCNIVVVNKYSMETFHIDTLKEDLFEVISRLSNEKRKKCRIKSCGLYKTIRI